MKIRSILCFLALTAVAFSCNKNGINNNSYPIKDSDNPRNEYSSDLPHEHLTEWTCVYFGFYPQAEVVPTSNFNAVTGISLKDGDIIVDANLYAKLQNASWDGDETTISGKKYRRMRGQDALTCITSGTGHYIFDDITSWHYFQYEPLRWRILNVSGDVALLLSDRALDCHEYDDSNSPSSWSSSSVRSWLNSDFYDSAFDKDEKEGIILSDVSNPDNDTYGSTSGPDTQDHVFLLATEEIVGEKGSSYGFYNADDIDDPARRMKPTMYAMCRGAWISMVEPYVGNTYWFLRTSGFDESYFSYICEFGFIYPRGSLKSSKDGAIVPAIRIDLSKAHLKPAKSVSSDDILEEEHEREYEDPGEISHDTYGKLSCPVNMVSDEYENGHYYHWDTIEYGSYPQAKVTDSETVAKLSATTWKGNETELGGVRYRKVGSEYFRYEPVCWRILNISGTKATLLADKVLDCQPYNEKQEETDWEACSLRKWLDSTFYDDIFSAKEKEAVVTVTNRNVNNFYFRTQCCSSTEDRFFLLSEEETFSTVRAQDYGFLRDDGVGDPARCFTASDYAVASGAWVSDSEDAMGNTLWILRTSGYRKNFVVYVDEYGFMYNRGTEVSCNTCGILPAITIDLAKAGL